MSYKFKVLLFVTGCWKNCLQDICYLSTMTQTAWLLVIIPDSMIIMLTFISIYQVNQTPASHRTVICLAFDGAIPGTHQVCLFIGNRSLSYQCSQKHLSTLPLYIIPSLTIYLFICLEPQESRSWVNPYSSHYCTIYGTLSLLTHANIFSWLLWQFIHFPPYRSTTIAFPNICTQFNIWCVSFYLHISLQNMYFPGCPYFN